MVVWVTTIISFFIHVKSTTNKKAIDILCIIINAGLREESGWETKLFWMSEMSTEKKTN